jgi:predicted metal-dependent enzyme (double-stranded beta helix superfamily)
LTATDAAPRLEAVTQARGARARGGFSPARCARSIYETLDAHEGDVRAAEAELLAILERLAREPGLLEIGLPRRSAHGTEGSWLYWDGEINILSARFPAGVEVPVHDHGTWEIVGAYEGELEYKAFKRLDDGSREGYAELAVTEDRVLGAGEFSMVPPPPYDIHGFRPRNGDMSLIGVIHGTYGEERCYFDPDRKSYVRQSQWAWGSSQGRDR